MRDRKRDENKNSSGSVKKKPVNRPTPSPSVQNSSKPLPETKRKKTAAPAESAAAEGSVKQPDEAGRKTKGSRKKEKMRPLAPPKEPVKPYVRRLRKFLLAAGTIIVLIAICVVLSLTVFFKIDEINIEGNTRYELAEIEEASMISKGDNLLLCNTAEGAEKIVNTFPYIESVEIEKKLFNKINIKVNEAKPSLVIESGGKYIVLAKNGKIVEINDKKTYNDVPTVLGAELNDVKLCSQIKYKDENIKKYLERIIELIAQYGIKNIRTIDMTDKAGILLVRENGFKVNIGNFENLDYKLKTAANILSENVKDDAKGTLDVGIASAQGGKSYLKLGEESSKKPEEKKQQSKPASKPESKQSSEASAAEESSQAADDGIVIENAQPQYDETSSEDNGETYDNGTDGSYTYDDGTTDNGGYTYDDGTTDGGETYDDGTTDGGETYDDGTTDSGETYDDGTTDSGETYDDGTTDGGETYDDGNADSGETYDNGAADGGETYDDGTNGGEETSYNDNYTDGNY